MKAVFATLVLCMLLVLPLTTAEIDITPYTNLRSQISESESALLEAQSRNQWETVISINEQLEALNQQLASQQMQFLQKYSEITPFVDETKFLISEVRAKLPADSMPTSLNYVESQLNALTEAEGKYSSQDYAAAASKLEEVKSSLVGLPASLTSSVSSAMKESINSKRSTAPSGTIQMMENGRKLINEAERSYKEASEKAFSKTVSDYLNPLSNGRSSFSEGLSLFSRQDTASPDDFLVKLILVLLPLVVCILIGLSIMSQKGPKNPLKNNLSKTKVKAGEESTIERRLEIANPESIQLFVKVADFPPQILSASDFSLEPARKANNAILWELNLKPKEKLSIRYKLKGTMQPGTINFPACSALFALEDGQRKFVGTSSKIDIK